MNTITQIQSLLQEVDSNIEILERNLGQLKTHRETLLAALELSPFGQYMKGCTVKSSSGQQSQTIQSILTECNLYESKWTNTEVHLDKGEFTGGSYALSDTISLSIQTNKFVSRGCFAVILFRGLNKEIVSFMKKANKNKNLKIDKDISTSEICCKDLHELKDWIDLAQDAILLLSSESVSNKSAWNNKDKISNLISSFY